MWNASARCGGPSGVKPMAVGKQLLAAMIEVSACVLKSTRNQSCSSSSKRDTAFGLQSLPQPGVSGWLALNKAGRRKDYTLDVQQQANMEPTTKAR